MQGFDSSLKDYLHERKFPVIGPIMKWTLRILTGGALYGLYEFNTNDIGAYLPYKFVLACCEASTNLSAFFPGITELVKRTWRNLS